MQREITRGIGVDGASACLTIGILLDQVLEAYKTYARLVDEFSGVDMTRVAKHFGENWSKMPNAKRRLIEETIRKEVDATNKTIQGHIRYLETNREHMDALGPRGREAVARKIVELTGAPEPDSVVSMLVQKEEGGLAA
ncbi:hypothetical protein GCM10027346_21000 [Hymenobacter seoulensis]